MNARIGASIPAAAEIDPSPAQTAGQLDQRQLLSMLTGGAAVGAQAQSAASAAGVTTSASGGISAANLSAILAGLGRGGGGAMQVI